MLSLNQYRVLTLGLGIMENLLFSGIMFGWVSLVYILKQEGYFSHLCIPPSSNSSIYNDSSPAVNSQLGKTAQVDAISVDARGGLPSCPQQDAQLQLVFTVATFCYEFILFPLGMLLDKFGTLFMRLLSSGLIVTGILLVAFSSMNHYLTFPGCALITVGGVELMFVNMQISSLFGRRKATIMALLSGCLDSSAFIFVLAKVGYENFDMPIQTFLFVLAGMCSLTCVNTILLPKFGSIPYPLPPGYREKTPLGWAQKDGLDTMEADEIEVERLNGNKHEDLVPEQVQKLSSEEHEASSASVVDDNPISSQSITETVKSERFPSLRSCFISLPSLCLIVWFSLLQLNMFFFLGTINPDLERLTDNDQTIVSRYTTALALFQAFSVLISPFCGLLLDRNRTKKNMAGGKRGPYNDLLDSRVVFTFTTLLYIVFNVTLLIQVVEVRYATFLIHIITRSFMYTLVITGCALFFPIRYFGSTTGLVESVASIIGLLQKPLFSLQQTYFNNDPFWVYIILIILNVITLILPVYIHIYVMKASSGLRKDQVTE